MADAARKHATYQDVLDAPPGRVAELLHGVLSTRPRPAGPSRGCSNGAQRGARPAIQAWRGGPGGWILLFEPEVDFGANVLVPDLAGWRRERLPAVTGAPYFTLAPDWVYEVLSPVTAKLDRTHKLPIYAEQGVAHAWLVDPLLRTLVPGRPAKRRARPDEYHRKQRKTKHHTDGPIDPDGRVDGSKNSATFMVASSRWEPTGAPVGSEARTKAQPAPSRREPRL